MVIVVVCLPLQARDVHFFSRMRTIRQLQSLAISSTMAVIGLLPIFIGLMVFLLPETNDTKSASIKTWDDAEAHCKYWSWKDSFMCRSPPKYVSTYMHHPLPLSSPSRHLHDYQFEASTSLPKGYLCSPQASVSVKNQEGVTRIPCHAHTSAIKLMGMISFIHSVVTHSFSRTHPPY